MKEGTFKSTLTYLMVTNQPVSDCEDSREKTTSVHPGMKPPQYQENGYVKVKRYSTAEK
jgi:hypothetical protein